MQPLENKVALVTGGAQGIGKAIATALASAGADVVIADLDLKRAENAALQVRDTGRASLAVAMDVTQPDSIAHSLALSLKRFARIDILVNNAGVLVEKGYFETTALDFDLCNAVNLKGVWLVSGAAAPHLEAAGGGRIVNIASVVGRLGSAICPAYSASKAGVINLTQSLASMLGPKGITVNTICPGPVPTPMTEPLWGLKSNPKAFEEFAQTHMALKRAITVEDIAQAVLFFTSPQSRNITGQALNVDAGYFMN